MSQHSVKLIGISGCSSAGKTTVVNALLESLPGSATAIFQDNYYYKEESGKLEYLDELKYYNWELLSGIDMDRMCEDVKRLLDGSYSYVLVDGFLLYEDDRLCEMLDKKYFIHVDKETCRQRRHGRVYDGQSDPENYFDRHVWPNFERYKRYCETQKSGIVYLDGMRAVASLVQFIKSDLC